MKYLFSVGNKYFESKMVAKAFRDESGGHVSKGPDHYKFHTVKNPKTNSGSSRHKASRSTGDGFKHAK